MGIKDLFSHGSSDSSSGDPAGSSAGDPGSGDGAQGQRVPHGEEPGASTTPGDDGKGTIGLGDRLGGAAPDTNQAKSEPMPPTPGHADPADSGPHTSPPEVPELGDMSAGMALAQVASPAVLATGSEVLPTSPAVLPTAGAVLPTTDTVADVTASGGPAPAEPSGTVPAEDRPTTGTSASTGRGSGPEMPESQTTGTAHRAPGQQGETPEGEDVESDTEAGAARMAPGGGPDQTPSPQSHPGDARGVKVPHEQPMEGTSQEQGSVQGIKDPAG